MALPRDFKDLLEELAGTDARYLLVGGYAAGIHARPPYSEGLQLWIDTSEDNLERVRTALMCFGAPAAAIDRLEALCEGDDIRMGRPPMRIDLVRDVPGLTFDSAYTRRVNARWEGVRVSVMGLEDLIDAGAPLQV